jgi:uncharacterized protein YpbB
MSCFETLILYLIKKLNGERTIYSIYHLLKGKKSSQTIQDAHFFKITRCFGIYQAISRELLENTVHHALTNKWIHPLGEQSYQLTEAGENMLQVSRKNTFDLLYLNGWKFNQADRQFWERLSILVQVVSNLVYSEPRYIPIQKNKQTLWWLKSFFKNNRIPRNLLGRTLYSELMDCLQKDPNLDPSVLVFRLTGYNKIGLTAQQTAEKLGMEPFRYQLQFINILHYLMGQIQSDDGRYPLMSFLLQDQAAQNEVLTKSTQKTYELHKMGYSLEKIAGLRNLKSSTIEDHIVEIALNIDDFSIDAFVDKELEERILHTARQLESRQLKKIKTIVPAVNYFEIRLVLAKHEGKQWN